MAAPFVGAALPAVVWKVFSKEEISNNKIF
jgi:hypothetical protein